MEIEEKYGHRFVLPSPPISQADYDPQPPEHGKYRGDVVSPKLRQWIFQNRNYFSPRQMADHLAHYPDPKRVWVIPEATITYNLSKPAPSKGRQRLKGGGRKPDLRPEDAERIVEQIKKAEKENHAMPNRLLRLRIGKALGIPIATQGMAARFVSKYGYVFPVL